MSDFISQLDNYIFLIPLAPLIGFLINGIIAKKLNRRAVHFVGVFSVFISAVISALALYKVVITDNAIVYNGYTWFSSGGLDVSVGFRVDQLSAIMINIVSGIGLLIHIYSVGYMKEDKGGARFFAYMNLFTFAMLILVMADNILLLFLGWEGVGLCSYLLIGFWYKNEEYASAGKKAFIVNRIGDFGFLLGIFLIFIHIGTLTFSEMPAAIFASSGLSSLSSETVTIITLLLFVGAVGKSAQIPLYVWLPDAMAGPTPVSALIHAATMVTAGVYMIGRLHFLFVMSEVTMLIILVVSGFTALYAGTIGITQNDIKKVLAYSTVSQLGYMFMAMAVGAFSVGIFHLLTHAFFKALLFLGSGSVIIACHHEQDMTKMGGLATKLPITYRAMFIGMLALSGVVPFISGFLSKDLVLEKVFEFSVFNIGIGPIFWIVGVLAAACTAFYSFRLLGMTFWGRTNMTDEDYHHVKEPSKSMSGVLVVLAILSVFGGLVGVPALLGGNNYIHSFLGGVFGETVQAGHHGYLPYVLMVISTSIGIIIAFSAAKIYASSSSIPDSFVQSGIGKLLYKFSYNKYYVDEVYDFLIVKPFTRASYYLWKFFDVLVIDGIVNGLAYISRGFGDIARKMNTGSINTYALSILIGVIALLIYLIV